MQHKILSLAVAAALAGVAGSASAAFTYTAADTAVVHISGSSATNNQLKQWAQNVLCNSTDQITLVDGKNDYAVVCTPKPGKVALSAGKTHIAVVKNSHGGSGNGITPLAAHSTLAFLDVFGAAVTDRVNAVPDIGVSDEEPALLVAAGAASGDVSKLNSAPLNVVTFGTPVTLGLYHALQDAQIASGKLAGSCKGTPSTTQYDAQGYSFSEACMPSLSKGQIASIFSGNAVDWSEFGLQNKDAQGNPLDNTIYIVRRVGTSGTQTGSRVFFLNDPCTVGVLGFVSGNDGQNAAAPDACNAATPAGTVFEASGGGNVEACLTNHDRNHRWAIGINSTELPAVSGDTTPEYAIGGGAATGNDIANKDYQRHIKIDGVSPSTFNVAVNRYSNWVEATMNTSNVYALSADAASLQAAMVSGFNDASVLVGLNNGFNTTALWHAAGETSLDSGIVAPAQSGVPAASANVADTHLAPVMYYTHSIGGAPNTCQPAMTYYATGLSE